MIKKYISLVTIFVLSFHFIVNQAFAYTLYQKTGTAFLYDPDLLDNMYRVQFETYQAQKIVLGSYTDATFTTPMSVKEFIRPEGVAPIETIYYKCNRFYQTTLYGDDGSVTGVLQFEATGINEPSICDSGVPYPTNTTGDGTGGTGDTGGTGGSGTGCIGCEMFNCPGWTDYMSGLEDIKNAIPPAPDWQVVAGTFRDTIVPSIISDLGTLLGSTPSPPAAPVAPSIPSLPSDLDDGGIAAPIGYESPDLGSSTFNTDDIKNEAETIIERTDPTGGGFSILDPVAGLPSQEEFIQNVPNEGSAELPANPIEGENVAPMPSDTTDTAPTPTDDTGTAPIPSESGEAPIPGDDGGTAPLPSESGTAPIPEEDWQPPIPD